MCPSVNAGSWLIEAYYPDGRQGSVEVAVFTMVWGLESSQAVSEFLTCFLSVQSGGVVFCSSKLLAERDCVLYIWDLRGLGESLEQNRRSINILI